MATKDPRRGRTRKPTFHDQGRDATPGATPRERHAPPARGAQAERLQKVLARAGVASRRAAEALISAGRVRVDGRIVTELGTKVDPRASVVELDGKRVLAEDLVYVVLHKPRNVVATMSDPEGRPTVRELLAGAEGRVYPVGRLDFATSGVLLATNDGDFAAAMLHPRKAVPKTYVVKVQGLMEEQDLERWRQGVRLEDGPTLPAQVELLRHEEGKTWMELTITEGRNQQIRRMGDATGFRVMRLARTTFAGLTSEGLPPGRWRYLSRDELTALKESWGVPRRIVSPPAAPPTRHAGRAPGVDDHGRASRRDPRDPWSTGEGREARRDPRDHRPGEGRDAGRDPRDHRGPSEGRDARRDPRDRGGPAQGRDALNRDRRPSHETQGGPRYGGGAPVRRDLGTTEDRGGGIRRGSSGARDGQDDRAAPPDAGDQGSRGRGGRTRTTGSGGGIGASGDESSYRVKGRKGW